MNVDFVSGILITFILTLSRSKSDYPPNFNVYEPPETSFTCQGKVVGGYYADTEASCQLFHICVQTDETQVQDFRFLCPNDTLFDQENFVCADWRDVNCSRAMSFYNKNLELFKPSEDEVENAWIEHEDLLRERRQLFEAPLSPGDDLETSFLCENNGYFADPDANCAIFHVCRQDFDGTWLDKKFICLNGTLFDQLKMICRPRELVNCTNVVNNSNITDSQLSSLQFKLNSFESVFTDTNSSFPYSDSETSEEDSNESEYFDFSQYNWQNNTTNNSSYTLAT